jgi:hypothetical protein
MRRPVEVVLKAAVEAPVVAIVLARAVVLAAEMLFTEE